MYAFDVMDNPLHELVRRGTGVAGAWSVRLGTKEVGSGHLYEIS